MSDEQQTQDIENVLKARREACRDVVAALEHRLAVFEKMFASPGWAALAAWWDARPENRIRELEAKVDAMEAWSLWLSTERNRLTEALAESEARIADLRSDLGIVKADRAVGRAENVRLIGLIRAYCDSGGTAEAVKAERALCAAVEAHDRKEGQRE